MAGESVVSTVVWEGMTFDTRYSPLYGENGEIQGVIAIGTDITERVRAEEAESLRLQELEVLVNTASIIIQPGTLGDKTNRVLEELSAVTAADRLTLRLVDEDRRGLHLVASTGVAGLESPPPTLLTSEDTTTGRAFRNGVPAVAGEDGAPFSITPEMRSTVAVPIIVEERILGTITATSTEVGHFRPDTVRLLNAVADGTGSLLENAHLLERMRESEERYRTLFEQSNDAILTTSEASITDINQAALSLLGFTSEEETEGANIRDLFADPDDQDLLDALLTERNSVNEHEIQFRRQDGSEFDGLVTATRLWAEDGRRIGTQAIIRDVTERNVQERALVESEEAARLLAHESSVMAEIGRIIGSSLDIGQVYERFVDQALRLVQADAVSVILVNPERETYSMAYISGLAVSERLPGTEFPLEGSATDYTYRTKEPLLFQPRSRDEVVDRFPGLAPAYDDGLVSFLATPLISQNEVFGVFFLAAIEHGAYAEADIAIAGRVASQIAGALTNADLYEARTLAEEQVRVSLVEKDALLEEIQQHLQTEQRRAEQLSVINDVGNQVTSSLDVQQVLEGVGALISSSFGYDLTGIGIVEDENLVFALDANPALEEPLRFSIGHPDEATSITAWVAAPGRPLLAPDVSNEPRYMSVAEAGDTRSELAVPIMASGQVIGVLDVQSDRLNAFDETDLTVVQSLAQQLGVAIENARLFDETRDVAVLPERTRMAREIHDTLAQGFTGIVLQLEAGEQALEDNSDEVGSHLELAKNLARQCLAEARRTVWDLQPQALEESQLHSALAQEVERFNGSGEAHATFNMVGARKQLSGSAQTALLRVCQESLTNIRKHADASNVEVVLDFAAGGVSLSVTDDGTGFDPDNVNVPEG